MAVTGKAAPAFGAFERSISKRYLGARKKDGGVGLIAWISFTCITLAIMAMIIIMSIMNGFREDLVSRIIGAQGHVYIATPEDTPSAQKINEITDWINAQDGVDIAFPTLSRQAFITHAGNGSGALVKGIEPQDLNKLDFVTSQIQFGDFGAFGQGEYGGDVIAIGVDMARTLNAAVGDTITLISPKPVATPFGDSLRRKPYVVGAIFSLGYVDADALYVYMPLEQALLFFDQGEASDEIEIRLTDPDAVKPFGRMLRKDMPTPTYVSDWQDRNNAVAGALRVEQVAMRIILMIVVLIAVFPVVAAMIMLVKNKGKDIAILRTIGVTQGTILRVFFMSGFAIGLAGTIAGLVLGIVFCLNIQSIQWFIELFTGPLFPPEVYQLTGGIPAKIKWGEVSMVAFWGLLISSIATFFPARGASKLDPVEAFRFE